MAGQGVDSCKLSCNDVHGEREEQGKMSAKPWEEDHVYPTKRDTPSEFEMSENRFDITSRLAVAHSDKVQDLAFPLWKMSAS